MRESGPGRLDRGVEEENESDSRGRMIARVIFVPWSTAFDFASNEFDQASCPHIRLRFLFYQRSLRNTRQLYIMDPQSQLDLSKLNESDKKELNKVLAGEAQKATLQQSE